MTEHRPPLAISEADLVFVDTTAFVNFAQHSALPWLVKFLGKRARIVDHVQEEIRRNSLGKFPALKMLDQLRGWPPVPPVELTPAQLAEVISLKEARAGPGDHSQADLGEIATVVAAAAVDNSVVLSDDGLARALVGMRPTRLVTSPDIAVQMVAAGALDADLGRELYNACNKYARREGNFDQDLGRVAQEALDA